jgi:hypothetical protein
MELRDAIDKADQVLDEERSSPTVQYSLRLQAIKIDGPLGEALGVLTLAGESRKLQDIRSQRPRQIEEDPRKWEFKSVNYNLLCALLSRVPEDSRPAFLTSVLARLASKPGWSRSTKSIQPSWNGLLSEFPLIAEFCIRNGAKRDFLEYLFLVRTSIGLAVLLRHLEDMIALNFTVLTDSDYISLAVAIRTLGDTASQQLKVAMDEGINGSEMASLCGEILSAKNALQEECRKARYLLLNIELSEGLNLEVNQDKVAVESHLRAQGFSDGLIESLNYTEQIYQSASSGFDFKNCMTHLRSLMEKLHSEGLAKFRVVSTGPPGREWGWGLNQLQVQGVLTKTEEKYVSALYTLLSDEGVHPIIAEKEYARLARNVVVEYALLFLRKLEKLRRTP